jgi:hypothetical protein
VRKHRWMAGLLMSAGMVISLGMLTSAPTGAQTTGSTTANTSANTTETTVATTVAGGGGVGGTTLAHTGTDSALPLEIAGGLLTLAVAGTALVKKTRQS